ncbi:hypothetical protein [Simiduia agarivorans]|uniref:hypothetical protein n=1 Tax=Simiduia agarivorans TaxID=447471 RepID=UPI001184137F|nr:hypothetical protein [Simiduia agarivorans]
MNKLRSYGLVSIAASLAFFALGLLTHTFEAVPGKIVVSKEVFGSAGGGSSTYKSPILSGNESPTASWVSVEYRYILNGNEHNSRMIGFYLPVNLNMQSLENGQAVTVYLAPFNLVSVLKRGADWRIVLALFGLGICLLIFYEWAIKARRENA